MTPAMQNRTAVHVNALPNQTITYDPQVGYAVTAGEPIRSALALPNPPMSATPSPDILPFTTAREAALMAQLTARGLYRQALANLSDTMDRWGGRGGAPEVALASSAVETAREAALRAAEEVTRAEAALCRQTTDNLVRAEAAAKFTAGVEAFKANVNAKAEIATTAAKRYGDAGAEVDADATEPPPTLADLQEDFLETQEVLAAARRAHQRTTRDLGDAETDADDAAALFAQALAA